MRSRPASSHSDEDRGSAILSPVSLIGDESTRLGQNAAAEPPESRRIGPYRLIRTIGHGGMGTVYLGVRDDDAFQKRVAIKVLKRGTDTDAVVSRFRHERQILASLDHPYIAGLLDGGTTPDGLPYFAMEYVEGQPIVEYCEWQKLGTTARLQLFSKVCAAVQYAHQNLVIHRDIKPGNVLVTADGTPKLLDFGIAKLLNPELGGHMVPTIPGFELMTPEYASPEQVRGDPVTTATDVYSLGVLLYELLTGRRPYRLTSRAPAEVARVVCESVPVRPSTAVTVAPDRTALDHVVTGDDRSATPTRTGRPDRAPAADLQRLRRRLAGDLDNIVLKALSKEPARRYASADQFAEDVRRHLAGLPVIARKDTFGYRTGKFVRRNRAAVVAAALTFVALVAGIIGTTWQARVAHAERQRAEQRFDDIRTLANSFLFELHDAIRDLPGSTPARKLLVSNALEYLDKLARDAGGRADLRRDLAAAYVRVGDVQGRPLHPNLGDTAGALESYRRAVRLYEDLRGAGPPDAALTRGLATAYLRVGEMLSSTGDMTGALASARKALDMQEGLASGTSASPDERRELAASYSRVGDFLAATGDVNAALEHRRRSLGLMDGLADGAPDDPATQRQLGVAYQKLGNTLGNPNAPNVGDFAGALSALERSAAIFREAAANHPSNATFPRNLAVVHSNTADVLLALDRPKEALESTRQALAAFEALVAADPANAAARNDAAIGHSKLAEMLDANGRTAEARAHYQQGLDIHQSLAALDPANENLKAQLASDYNRLATAQAKLGERVPSLANHDRAVTISESLSSTNAGDIELQVAVALAHMGRADAYLLFARRPRATGRGGDLSAAEAGYVKAVELLTALHEKKAIEGTDVQTLETARAELAKIRQELAGAR
jgi:serine/threonine protein kinase/tetratricopeptide (TPR) repeat protein